MYLTKCYHRPTLSDFLNEVFENRLETKGEVYLKPSANVAEDEKGYTISLALPGFEKNEISLKLENDALTVEAAHEAKETGDPKFNWAEFTTNSKYRRSFTLPEDASIESISAEYKNGILKVTIAKAETKPEISKEIAIA